MSNAKHNAKASAKASAKKRANAEAALATSKAGKHLLTNEERDTLVGRLSTDTHLLIKCQHDGDQPDERLRGYSLDQLMDMPELGSARDQLMDMPEFCCYVGYTGQQRSDEALRWLTQRGKNNRPVLEWAEPRSKGNKGGLRTHITMGEARDKLGFRSLTLWTSKLMVNCTYVEDKLHRRYHSEYGLPRRLYRECGKGANSDKPGATEKLHQVFLDYSFDVSDAIESGEVVVVA